MHTCTLTPLSPFTTLLPAVAVATHALTLLACDIAMLRPACVDKPSWLLLLATLRTSVTVMSVALAAVASLYPQPPSSQGGNPLFARDLIGRPVVASSLAGIVARLGKGGSLAQWFPDLPYIPHLAKLVAERDVDAHKQASSA